MKFDGKTFDALRTLALYENVSNATSDEAMLLKDIFVTGYADEAQEEDLYDTCIDSIKGLCKDIKSELSSKDGAIDIDSIELWMSMQKKYFKVLKYILKNYK